ncbi:hypothetical protein D9Q98_010100 [Chlorella vulgaris]|uniref:Amino acid transporter transmembrane domain-containing protein n=1 Tax=Chlorella vulgaris TaxID=3077 RepID=A0A9D4YWA0_CHLVU|nr:hypothetical protein D9Q98_010100 [Chlorella vulgaris]
MAVGGAGGYRLLIEDGGGGSTGVGGETRRRALFSATATLTLAILGSSVLPVPYAFSRLGVLPGLGVMLLVALSNAVAGTLLLRAAASLDKHTFEGLAEAVGGRSWKLATETCLVLLLYGNLTGDFCLLADMGSIAAGAVYPGGPPPWLVAGGGRLIMGVLAVLVVFPLSCLRHMRQLEKAGMAGVAFVAALAAIFVYQASAEGFPAVRSGELPLLRPAVAAGVPESVGVLSFAFYLTPMLLPLLREMPAGSVGVDLTCRAVQIVTAGVAYVIYAVMGFFAASRYGLRTEGDVLVNSWLPARWDGVLDALMVLYLSVCMAPIAFTLRCQLENLLIEEGSTMLRGRQVLLTAACLLSSLLLAMAFPTQAEKMFAVTGATAVCAVCYVVPVAIHLRLYLRGSGWWCYGGGNLKGLRDVRQRMPSPPSFSFDPQAPGAAPGPGGGTPYSPELRRLLLEEHQLRSASLPRLQPGMVPSLRQLAAAAVPEHDARAERAEEGGEEALAAAAGPFLGGHRWTDLSLNGWLRGQSYDSMAAFPDSQSATPVSPSSRHGRTRGGGGGSVDSLAGGEQGCGSDKLEAAVWEAREQGINVANPHCQQQQQQQQQQATCGTAGATSPLLQSVLSAVPEARSVAGTDGGWHCSGGIYPCWADAGNGVDAALSILRHLAVPLAVLVLGVASSVSALCLAVAALL